MSSAGFQVLLLVLTWMPRLALANWFRDSNISVLLVDKKPGPTPRGQAEGLKSTTNEIFAAFGIGPQIAAESWSLEEIAIWGPSQDGSGIVREQVVQDKVDELGTTRETQLQQCKRTPSLAVFGWELTRSARVEHHMLENLKAHDNIAIKYSTRPTEVTIDTSCSHLGNDYPVVATLTHVSESEADGDEPTNVGFTSAATSPAY